MYFQALLNRFLHYHLQQLGISFGGEPVRDHGLHLREGSSSCSSRTIERASALRSICSLRISVRVTLRKVQHVVDEHRHPLRRRAHAM